VKKFFAALLTVVAVSISIGPSAVATGTLTGKLSAIGSKGQIHESLTFFQVQFLGSAILNSVNCAQFLSKEGSDLQVSLAVPGKSEPATRSLSEGLKKTVSLSSNSLTCDFLIEGMGRDLYFAEPVGDFYGGSPSVTGQMTIANQSGNVVSSEVVVVDFDNTTNHPKLTIKAPQRLEAVSKDFLAEIEVSNTQLWIEEGSARAEICQLTDNCERPGYEISATEAKSIMYGEAQTMGVFLDPDTLAISAPVGTHQLALSKGFRLSTVPKEYLPWGYCSMIYAATCASATGVQVFEAREGDAPSLTAEQVKRIENVAEDLKLNCPKSIGANDFSCLATFDSQLGNFPVASSKSVTFCVWKNPIYSSGCTPGGKSKPAMTAKAVIQSGGRAVFKVSAKLITGYKSVDIFAEAVGDQAVYRYVKPPTPPKALKPITVNVTTVDETLLGETHNFFITTRPAISGTCVVYRASLGMLYKVASVPLVRGKASGVHRWLWSDSGASMTPMSLTVDCFDKSFGGTGYAIVKGYR
jgi:hypothetical protein